MKHLLTLIAVSMLASAAHAIDLDALENMPPEQRREAIKALSPQEREAFHAARKEKWQGLSKEEKVQLIEKRRMEMKTHRESKWEAMSDDEKIEHAEKMMEKRKDYRGKGKHHERDDE